MCQERLDAILEPIAKPFDEAIHEKGLLLDAALGQEHQTLLDELDELHWRRTAALVEKAFEVGLDVGLVLGQKLSEPFRPEGS